MGRLNFFQEKINCVWKTQISSREIFFPWKVKKYFKEIDKISSLEAYKAINQMNNFCENLTPEQSRKSLPIKDSFYWKGEEELKIFYNK